MEDRAGHKYRRIVSSIPSLPGSKRAFVQEADALISSVLELSILKVSPAVRRYSGLIRRSPTVNVSDLSCDVGLISIEWAYEQTDVR